jgi:hypothetical protein
MCWHDASKLIIGRMVAVDTALEHTQQSVDDIDHKIEKKLRDHIAKILRKIPRGTRPVAAVSGHSRLLGATPD